MTVPSNFAERRPEQATPLEAVTLDVVRLALEGNIRSLRQRTRNLLRDGDRSPLSPSSREYLGELLATIEPVVQPLRTPVPRPLSEPKLGATDGGLLEYVEQLNPFAPVLDEQAHHTIERLVLERAEADRLRLAGVAPTSTVLLSGPPGVGKTMTANWLADAVGLPLVRLQASVVMSSLLGQSARNLGSALEEARSRPSLLFLDEFDAYARRRDDNLDIAEPKRLVNSLLLELESWPDSGMIVAATNHLHVLDPAIERRFDLHLRLEPPNVSTRERLIRDHLSRMGWDVDSRLLAAAARAVPKETTGSELARLCRSAVRNAVLEDIAVTLALARTFLPGRLGACGPGTNAVRRAFVAFADEQLALPDRDLAELTGVTVRTLRELRRKDKRTQARAKS